MLIAGGATRPDPFLLNEYPPQGVPNGVGYRNARGRVEVSSIIADRPNTQIIIVDGQSEHATANGTSAHTVSNSAAHQLNVYDGGIYEIAEPLLGCSYAPAVGPSSMIGQMADYIIDQALATRVIMVPIAIGGTPWAIYDPAAAGSLFTRFRAAYLRLQALGLEPDHIIAARGATDGVLGTSAADVTTAIHAWADGVRALGCDAPIWLGKFTMVGGSANSTVRTGMDNAIHVGRDIRAGYDGDTHLTVGGGYRLDGVHLSNTGLQKAAEDWVDLIFA
jgi:hypothetical protein